MTTDPSAKGLASLIGTALTGFPRNPAPKGAIQPRPADYDREHCVDLTWLSAFLRDTQPEAAVPLNLDGPTRHRFLVCLQGKSARAGPSTCCARESSTAPLH